MRKKFPTLILLILLLLTAAILGAGCIQPEVPATGTLKKFGSEAQIRDYLAQNEESTAQQNYFPINSMAMQSEGVGIPGAAVASSMKSMDAVTRDYSQTNVQVSGVDEADFVKNDGTYIYLLSGNSLLIVDAYPADSAKVLSQINIPDISRNLFVQGERLAVFSTSYTYPEPFAGPYGEMMSMPRRPGIPVSHVLVYSLKDRSNPRLIEDFSIDGDYFDTRMIGDTIYLITRLPVSSRDNPLIVPSVKSMDDQPVITDVFYFDRPEPSYVFHTVTSIDLSRGEMVNSKTFLLGYSNVMYMSPKNLYLSYSDYTPKVQPLANQRVADSRAVSAADFEEQFNRMTEAEKQEYIQSMGGPGASQGERWETEQARTVIHKIILNNGEISYSGKGEVPGILLNQFSMDEDREYLRVATTSDVWTSGGSLRYNNVYVLDAGLNRIGSLDHIAPDEKIYSTRFIGDRLYMVTFRQVDPFFVIDLSDPARPRILGKLKLPGYSDYLHPFDRNHIIGVGKETTTGEWGGVSVKGVKLALFDVSDVNNPTLVDNYVIGDRGTDSEALRDHKAFLFDSGRNILVIPITEVTAYRSNYPASGVWQGAYVFSLTTQGGFELLGRVSHSETDKCGEKCYNYAYTSPIRRSLYIDDVLYTISMEKIQMNALMNPDTVINSIQIHEYDAYPQVK